MCVSINLYICASVWSRNVCVRVCVRMAACQPVPSGCLTELLSLTGRLIAVAAPRLCQTSPWGVGGNRQSTCWCLFSIQPQNLCLNFNKKQPPVTVPCLCLFFFHSKRLVLWISVLCIGKCACVCGCLSPHTHPYISLLGIMPCCCNDVERIGFTEPMTMALRANTYAHTPAPTHGGVGWWWRQFACYYCIFMTNFVSLA